MDLPSPREIELETLVRQRDTQIAELTDELTHLRQYLSTQPSPNTTDSLSLPPALVTLLLPHIKDHTSSATGSASGTVTSALTQRVKVLQEENDELYELLKSSETGHLKDDVRALRRVVQKLEGALRESHQTITSLSGELEKTHATLIVQHKPNHYNPHSLPHSPAPGQTPLPSQPISATNGQKKLPPTGPRAHKKPRLSESQMPPQRPNPPPPPAFTPKMYNRPQSSLSRHNESRERSPRPPPGRKAWPIKMDVDEDQRTRPRSPRSPERSRENQRERERDVGRDDRERERERERARDRNWPKDKDREKGRQDRKRDRERDRPVRRNVVGNGGGGGRRDSSSSHPGSYAGADRTLAERMGL
ncbi:unnamed protein product [Somion occarium]|uniref:Uncharacterized protein n=1 Tax=Somion occarium TaxID=3059160 RepID=A0ABP1D2B4_9APHY